MEIDEDEQKPRWQEEALAEQRSGRGAEGRHGTRVMTHKRWTTQAENG